MKEKGLDQYIRCSKTFSPSRFPTRSSSKLSRDQTSNPTSSTNPTLKGRIRRSSKQKVENSNFEEHLPPVATMTDNHTMAEMLRAPIEGCAEAIVVPPILAEQFELKHSLINMMTSEQFFGLKKDNPHDHIRWGSPPVARKRTPRVPSPLGMILSRFLNAAAGGNLLEKSPQDTLMITSPINAYDINSSSEIAKLTHAVKAVEEICVTCRDAHPYYQCLAAGGNTFPEFWDNIQGYVSAAAGNYNQGNLGYRPQGVANQMRPPDMLKNELRNEMKTSIQTSLSNQTNEIKNMMANLLQMNTASTSGPGSLPGNTVANLKGEIKAITTRSGLVTDGPTVPTPLKFVTPEEGESVEETYTDPDLAEYTIKVPPPPQGKDEIQIQKFWHMFKQLHLNITLAEALVLMPKYQKMLKALLSNKEKLQELVNTPLNENCSAVILKKLPEKLRDLGKFLIPCGFSELKCKSLADLGASINLMPLSVWRKLGLHDLIPTRMTLELANRAICTPDGIARDVFVPVGKFTFPADFVVVDCESDPRVPLILERPFLRTGRALIDVHGEEMILRDGDERLTLNMKHDTASYSNHPHRESTNLINIFNVSSEDCLEVSISKQQSGNPIFSLHKEITSPEVTHEIHDSEGCNFLSEELPDIDSFNDIHPYFDDNPLSSSTTYSSKSLLEEFTDELDCITYPLDCDDNLQCNIESDLREIEVLLYQGEDSDLKDSIDQMDLANLDDYFVDPTPEMFNDKHAPGYSFPPRFDVYPDDFLEIESDADNFYDDPFDSKGEKIKESKLLIDELDLPCDILPYSKYDSFASQDFSKDDDFPSPDNEDKVFNLGFLIQEKSVTIITRVAQENKLAISYTSLVFEDSDPPFYEPFVFKDVLKSMRLLPFSSKNEEKVFKPGIYTSEKEFPDIDSFNDIHPHFDDDPVSGSTTYSANSLLEEFVDELALISYPPDYDDNRACDIESDIREIEFSLFQSEDSDFKDLIDQSVLTYLDDLFVDPTPEMFTDEQPLDYSFPPRFDVYPDDFLEIKYDATFDDDYFYSKAEKIKEAELLIDPLDLPCDILSEILSHDKSVKIITRVTPEKKLAVSFASWLSKDFDPPFYELLVFKEVRNSIRLLPFLSENEEKVFKPGIYIFKKFHCCFLSELSHPGSPAAVIEPVPEGSASTVEDRKLEDRKRRWNIGLKAIAGSIRIAFDIRIS
nr:hypothetical protein [Tanacetum cinerariifolium]